MAKNKALRLFDLVMNIFAYIAGILVLLVALFVSYTVVVRYLHFKPPGWVLQYTEYALLWITFLGAAWLLREEGHINIDTLLVRLPPRVRTVLDIVVNILGGLVCLVIVGFGTAKVVDFINRGIMDVKGVTLPMYPIFIIIPVGGLLLLIQFIRNVFKHVRIVRNKEDK